MTVAIKTIEQLVVEDFKSDGFWFVFNTHYNDLYSFGVKEKADEFLSKEYTDQVKRNEFLHFMESNHPDVVLHDVMDLVPLIYEDWPYLGSIAVEMKKGDSVYNSLCIKYGSPFDPPSDNGVVFWTIDYDFARSIYEQRF